ncbi:putative F-box/FBD/LRR-repeat protein At4g03220 [Bidens hawaiensis]|uniref:putative F-box/FBD/LRR-repeat protein At4g03220 n=1 Tax=Bidens hawaiensis TaxID=980011 RepID=UPI00404ACFFB
MNKKISNRSKNNLESVRLCCANYCNRSTVQGWIHAAVIRKVKQLDLLFSPRPADHDHVKLFEPPYNLVKYDALEVLKLFLYTRPLVFPFVAGGFPALRVLELNSVRLSDSDLVHQFLDRSPLLEDLSFAECFSSSIVDLYISCPNLKTLRIHNDQKMDDYGFHDEDSDDSDVEEDYDEFCKIRGLCKRLKICCPKLVFWEYVGQPAYEVICGNPDALKKAVIYPNAMAQKGRSFKSFGGSMCELFAGVSHVESLSLNHSFIRAIKAARDLNGNFLASLGNLKTLEISTTIDKYAMNVVIRILRCCANLESFHLIIEEEIIAWDKWELEQVLARHLNRVEFLEFNGGEWKLDMACFLLGHGSELEEMVFSWRDKVKYHKQSKKIMKKLVKLNKASSTVKLSNIFC